MGDTGWQFVVGLVVGFFFNWLLNLLNQRHERRLATFEVEIEELKSQLSVVTRAWSVVEKSRWVLEHLVAGDDEYSEDDLRQAGEEAFKVHLELSAPSLTTSDEFDAKWRDHYSAYST